MYCVSIFFSIMLATAKCHSMIFLKLRKLYCIFADKSMLVPPAYGDFRLALVMHSNEGGPGPRHCKAVSV